MHPTTPRRGGFTLIELLVVISILALLAALTVAGVSRVRTTMLVRTTDDTVKKIQSTANTHLSAVLDDAAKNAGKLEAFCDRDADRAKALSAYLYARWWFPQTFDEARSPVVLRDPTNGNAVVTVLDVRQPFRNLPTSGASGLTPEQQSAALLFTTLTEGAPRGMAVSLDDVMASSKTTIPNTNFNAFKDAWGTPISFVRWSSDPEVQGPPYADVRSVASNGTPAFDPFDRLGTDRRTKLGQWNNTPKRTAALAALGLADFDGANKVLTAYSLPNKQYAGTYGYRLARFGNRGD